jgi:type VI secretion system protein ImpC
MPFGNSNLEMDFSLESEKSGIIEDTVFQILVLGDWAGSGERRDLGSRKPIAIDRDNFDDVLNGLGVRLKLEIAGADVELEFNSLDDFHPDEIYKRVPLFSELRELRKRLRNSDTFHSAAREVREWSGASREEITEEKQPAEPPSEGLLDAILSSPDGGGRAPKPAISSDLSALVGELVRPHLLTVDEGEQASMVAAVDEATSSLMRSILHDRRFQQLEAAWRGLFFLVRRTETSSESKIFILDVTKDELEADLRTGDDITDSVLFKRITGGRDREPWAATFGNYAFMPSVDDIAALIRLGKIGAAANTPFVSHIRPNVLGVTSLAEHPNSDGWDLTGNANEGKLWAALRGMPESRYIGLTMPRFLVRLPYGSATEPTEVFAFEEFTEGHDHDKYLWANPCFVVANLLAITYTELGWDFGSRFYQDVDGLPLHMYQKNGETIYQPCGEVLLSQNAAEKLLEYGIMPIVTFKNSDRIRLARFQSISDPPTVLRVRRSG